MLYSKNGHGISDLYTICVPSIFIRYVFVYAWYVTQYRRSRIKYQMKKIYNAYSHKAMLRQSYIIKTICREEAFSRSPFGSVRKTLEKVIGRADYGRHHTVKPVASRRRPMKTIAANWSETGYPLVSVECTRIGNCCTRVPSRARRPRSSRLSCCGFWERETTPLWTTRGYDNTDGVGVEEKLRTGHE